MSRLMNYLSGRNSANVTKHELNLYLFMRRETYYGDDHDGNRF